MKRILALIMLMAIARSAYADHPIEVERKAAADEYLRAMVAYQKIPQRRLTTSAILAAARSAWALGLVDEARKEFDRALRDTSLDARSVSMALVSRGAIEYQEGHYPVAAHFAEKAIEIGEPSTIASALTLLADSLMKQGRFGDAAGKLAMAAEQAAGPELPSIAFRQGQCFRKLGSAAEARIAFEKIPLDHEHAASAVRALAEIALEEKRFDDAEFWLGVGREKFPNRFLDSWTDYAQLLIAIEKKDSERVRAITAETAARFPPSDPWVLLLNATAEAYLWHATSPRKEE